MAKPRTTVSTFELFKLFPDQNSIESAFAVMKRGIIGVYHQISEKMFREATRYQ